MSETVGIKSRRRAGQTTLADLRERVAALEVRTEEKPKHPRDQFMAWAGVLALVISITTGGLTVADRIFFRARVEALQDVQQSIASIAAINKDTALQMMQAKTPAESSAIASNANLEKWRLLTRAESALPKVEGRLRSQDYLILAQESAYTTNRYDKAIAYSSRAVALARKSGDKTELSEVLRMHAQLVSMSQGSSSLEEARKYFAEARAAIDDANTFGSSAMRARLASDTIALEAFWGDCARIPALLDDYAMNRDRTDVGYANRANLQQSLEKQLQGQSRCEVRLPPLPVEAPRPSPVGVNSQ